MGRARDIWGGVGEEGLIQAKFWQKISKWKEQRKVTKLNGSDNINIKVQVIDSGAVTRLICLAVQTSYRFFISHKMCGNWATTY